MRLTTTPCNQQPSWLPLLFGADIWIGGVRKVQQPAEAIDGWDLLVDAVGGGPTAAGPRKAKRARTHRSWPSQSRAQDRYNGPPGAQARRKFAPILGRGSAWIGASVYFGPSQAKRGVKVLVFCQQSEYRSVAVTTLLVSVVTGLSVQEAVGIVRSGLPQALHFQGGLGEGRGASARLRRSFEENWHQGGVVVLS